MTDVEFFVVLACVVIGDVWALQQTLTSEASTPMKISWTVIVLLFPILGFSAWYFSGPRGR